ncbi:MAG: CoA pyrophosphatase [Candidatus Bipolaricaulia bacterium]
MDIQSRITVETIRDVLAREKKRRLGGGDLKPSAVLFPMFERDGQLCMLFTQRTETVAHHKGQISFPGGVQDPEDETLLETALREAHEEIGLRSEDVELLGELDDVLTVSSGFVITPFVGLIPWPYRFQVNQREVAQLIEVPAAALVDERRFRVEVWASHEVYFYEYQSYTIWGATAHILKRFFDRIGDAL